MFENLRELYQYRALLGHLIDRELKVRYRGSALGFLWTFLNPVLQMAVYSLVFSVYTRNEMPHYAYYMFVGLLPWNWLATSLVTGTASIADRRDLISKVRFPPQILPATVVGAALVNYALSLPLMLGFGLIDGVALGAPILAWPLVAAVQLVLIAGIVYLTSSFNVFFRDLQQIMGNIMMFSFFLTPIIYSPHAIPVRYRDWVQWLNPAAPLMRAYQDIFYANTWPDWLALARVFALGLGLLFLGAAYMGERRETFAEAA